MVRKALIIAATIVLALSSTAAFLAAETKVQTKSFPAVAGDTIVVQNDFGRVQVRVRDGSEIQARVQMVASGSMPQEFQVAMQKTGREIYFYSFFSGQSQESVNLEIQAPRFLNVVIWGANPEVNLQGLEGSVRVQNISGTITVEDVTSSVTVASDRGDIVYRAHVQPHGDVHLESTNGNVRCELADNLNLRGWLRGGGSVAWDKEPDVQGTSQEKQLGSFGPLLSAVSLKGNVRVALGPAGSPARTASTPVPAQEKNLIPEQGAKPAAATKESKEPYPAAELPKVSPGSGPPAGAPQSAPMPSGPGVAIKVNVDAVLLNVSVRDRHTNRSVIGLQRGDFRVYEDGVPQEVQQVLTTEAPFNLLLLLDVSGSTGSYIKLMKEAATDFTRQINEKDKIAIATFNSSVQLLQDFTNDRSAAARAISRIHSGGGTAFYDALMTCIDQFMRNVEGRKAIVVFTDGVDNQLYGSRGEGSRTPFKELYRRVQEIDTIIYTIFLDSEAQNTMTRGPVGRYPGRRGGLSLPFPIPLPVPQPYPTPGPTGRPYPGGGDIRAAYESARDQLETIAEQTGGRMYSPHRAQDLAGAYSEVADDLRMQYLISYASSNPTQDDRWRSIRVEVNDHPEAVVRTRKGYYAVNRGPLTKSTIP